MNILCSLLAGLCGLGQTATGTGRLTAEGAGEGALQFDAMWDEVLITSMHCENARMVLDCMGPRWK